MAAPPPPAKTNDGRLLLVVGGVFVVALGFGLPQLLLGPPAIPHLAEDRAIPHRRAAGPELAPVPRTLPDPEPAASTSPEMAAGSGSVTLAAPEPAIAPNPINLGESLGRLAACFAALAVFCFALVRWFGGPKKVAAGDLAPEASLRVAGRFTVHLVRVGNRRILVGTDAAGVKATLELPAAPPPKPPARTASRAAAPPVRTAAPRPAPTPEPVHPPAPAVVPEPAAERYEPAWRPPAEEPPPAPQPQLKVEQIGNSTVLTGRIGGSFYDAVPLDPPPRPPTTIAALLAELSEARARS